MLAVAAVVLDDDADDVGPGFVLRKVGAKYCKDINASHLDPVDLAPSVAASADDDAVLSALPVLSSPEVQLCSASSSRFIADATVDFSGELLLLLFACTL
jgi:hypothetical protein